MCNPTSTDANENDVIDVEKQKENPSENEETPATTDVKFIFWRRTAIFFGALALCLLVAEIVTAVYAVKKHQMAVESKDVGEDNTVSFPTVRPPNGTNPCAGTNPKSENVQCVVDGIVKAGEQAATNVTKGYNGKLNTTAVPIKVPFCTLEQNITR
jgi:hypothetical protein